MQLGGLDLTTSRAGVKLTRRSVLAALLLTMCRLAQAESSPQGEIFRIGVDANYLPYSYFDENHRLTGLDPSLAREACRRIGVKPSFVPIVWDKKNELMEKGSIDCVWSCFSVNGREDQYLWIPYLYSRQVVVVEQSSDIKTVADLAGDTVAVQSGTRPESYFMQDDAAPDVEELISMPSTAEAFIAMRSGFAQAVVGHEAVLQQLLQEIPGTYRELEDPLLSVKVGVAFPLNSRKTQLFERLRTVMSRMAAEGEVARMASAFGLDGEKVTLVPVG